MTTKTTKESSKNLKAVFKCGDCFHFKSHAHASKEQVCSAMGVRAYATAPKCFTPDVTQIAGTSDQLAAIANLYHGYTDKQRRILLSFLQAKPHTFTFGTKVYFLAAGQDYLSNYLSGYVIGYTSSKEVIVSGDPDNKERGATYVATFTSEDSVYTVKQFHERKEYLIENDLILDPDKPLIKFKPREILDNYEPPTLDNAPKAWKETKKKKKKKGNELRIL